MDTKQEEFRSSLCDTLAVLKRLTPHCKDCDEMQGLIELAVGVNGDGPGNEAQLKILMGLIIPAPATTRR